MTAVQEETRAREHPAGDCDPADGLAGAAPRGYALVTPDTDGRWTLAMFILALLLCGLVYAGLWAALMLPAPAADWSAWPEYRGWEVRP